MQNFLNGLSRHKNQAHLLIFALITLPAIGLYYSAPNRSWSLVLLAPIVLGNLLAILIR